MKPNIYSAYRTINSSLTLCLSISSILLSQNASAAILNASLGGTFNMNLDRNAFAILAEGTVENPGHFLVHYYDTAESDYTQFTDSYFYLGNTSRTEIPAINLVHDITPVSTSNPGGQAQNRYVKSTTPNFSVNSDTLAGTGTLGMTGMELFRGSYNGSLLLGDLSLRYGIAVRQGVWEELEQEGTPSGWYLQNNVSFSAVAYDLENLTVEFSDANNWKMSGDLLMSPENADFMHGARLADMGDFCLGVGSYAGCGVITAVPVPSALWLFVSSLGSLGLARRFGNRSAS